MYVFLMHVSHKKKNENRPNASEHCELPLIISLPLPVGTAYLRSFFFEHSSENKVAWPEL